MFMQYLAAVLAIACVAAGASARAGTQPPPDLRRVLQHYHPDTQSAPRQLSPPERAELRRQLREQKEPPPRRTHRKDS